jgi:hypothetical protein
MNQDVLPEDMAAFVLNTFFDNISGNKPSCYLLMVKVMCGFIAKQTAN